MRGECAEALTGRALQPDKDAVLWKAFVTEPAGDLARKHGSDASVHVADLALNDNRPTTGQGRLCRYDEVAVEHRVEVVSLGLRIAPGDFVRNIRRVKQPAEIDPVRFPVIDCASDVEKIRPPDQLVDRADADRSHDLAQFLGNKEEIIDDMLGRPDEARA